MSSPDCHSFSSRDLEFQIILLGISHRSAHALAVKKRGEYCWAPMPWLLFLVCLEISLYTRSLVGRPPWLLARRLSGTEIILFLCITRTVSVEKNSIITSRLFTSVVVSFQRNNTQPMRTKGLLSGNLPTGQLSCSEGPHLHTGRLFDSLLDV